MTALKIWVWANFTTKTSSWGESCELSEGKAVRRVYQMEGSQIT